MNDKGSIGFRDKVDKFMSRTQKTLEIGKASFGEKHTEKRKWWVICIYILLTILVLLVIEYYVIFATVQNFVSSMAGSYHWMLGWGSGLFSFIVAAILAKPIYVALGRAFTWKLRYIDYFILGSCLTLIAGSGYLNRNVFFAKGVPPKEICAALLPGDAPTVKGLGLGANEGLTCLQLTPKEAALAVAIDRSKPFPKEIIPNTMSELELLELYKGGAVAIYIGKEKLSEEKIAVKIYDGPGFNPRRLGILMPITEDELISYKAAQRAIILQRENVVRLQKEEEARAAAELAERQRKAAEAEAARLRQERLATEEAERRKVEVETRAIDEKIRQEAQIAKKRSDWWWTLLAILAIGLVATVLFFPLGILFVIFLLLHISTF